jgi:hypothetical protein
VAEVCERSTLTMMRRFLWHGSSVLVRPSPNGAGARRAEAVAEALVASGIAAARITDPPISDLKAECQNVRSGVVSCGEAGSTGPSDRQVLARFSRATVP